MEGEWTTIGDIAQVFDGPHATPKKLDEGPYFLSISSLEAGKLDLEKSARISDEQFEKWTKRVTPEEGDLLFSYETRLGEAALMPGGIKACLGRRMGLLRPSRAKVDPRYLLYAYLGPEFQQEIKTRTNYGATVDRLALKELPNFPIQLPPLHEQKAIAHILGTLDDKIELNRRMNATLEEMAQALFKSWFVDFDPVIDNALVAGNPIPDELVPRAEVRKKALAAGTAQQGLDGDSTPSDYKSLFPDAFQFTEELGWIPEGWQSLPVLSVCDLLGGSQPPASTFIDYPKNGYIRLLQIRDFSNDNHITYIPDTPKARKVEEDDILIGRYGSASGDRKSDSMGRICRGKQGAYNVALMKLHPILAGREYCLQLYDSDSFYNYLHGTGNKAVQSGFSKKELHNYRVCLPPKELRRQYEEFGDLVWKRKKQTSAETHALIKLRDTLLPELISGEISVPEASIKTQEAVT